MNSPDAIHTADSTAAPRLEKSLSDPRTLASVGLSVITAIMAVIACIPLFSVLIMLIWRGGARLSWQLFTELPPTAFEDGGGFGNAIVGTLMMVGIAAVVSVPFGVLAAVFLAELRPDSKLAETVRFCAKTLTGLPSISRGSFRLCRRRLVDRHVFRPGGRRRPFLVDVADGDVDSGGSHEDGAGSHERGRLRHGVYARPGGVESGAAHRPARYVDGSDAGGGSRLWGNGAVALHRSL